MSVHAPLTRKKISIAALRALRASNTPITVLTAYDYPTALALSSSVPSIDITLVGDSLAQTALGLPSTTSLTLDEVIHHAKAVSRGTTTPFLVVDMPFGSFHVSEEQALQNALRIVKEAAVDAVKLEGGREIAPIVQRLTSVGIPVMAHVGLLPQRHIAMSGYRVQGKEASGAEKIWEDAKALQEAGAFSMVIEAVPTPLAKYITENLDIPTIGIGAGPYTSGQVLVWDDILSTTPSDHKPKFVRRFADVRSLREHAISAYASAVRERSFPHEVDESYRMDKSEWDKFIERRRAERREEQK